jgi:hypothetical protein
LVPIENIYTFLSLVTSLSLTPFDNLSSSTAESVSFAVDTTGFGLGKASLEGIFNQREYWLEQK